METGVAMRIWAKIIVTWTGYLLSDAEYEEEFPGFEEWEIVAE